MLTTNDIAKCERWFDEHGLPYFVEARHEALQRATSRGAFITWTSVGIGAGVLAALAIAATGAGVESAILTGVSAGVLVALLRGVVTFRVLPIIRWAVRHALESVRLLGPLVTRALPLLLLIITFLFINTEVWQVASSLTRPRLIGALACFGGLAVAFLWPSFSAEITRLGVEVDGDRLIATTSGTPVASAAREILAEPGLRAEVNGIRLPRLQRSNLLLMLFITQAIQLVALALVVFAFFVLFGSLVIRPSVIEAWTGAAPHYTGPLRLISDELFAVALFLAGFAGLYFTVQAVIDQNYRREFFSHIEDDLQRAIGVRKVYVALRAHLLAAR